MMMSLFHRFLPARNGCFLTGLLACCILSATCRAQFYPTDPIVPESRLPVLLAALRNAETGTPERNRALIDLANLYYNKPRKRFEDLDKAIAYARAAVSVRHTRQESHDGQRATKLLALAAIDKQDFPSAENLLRQLYGQYKLDLQLRLAYAYCEADKDLKDADWAKAIALAQSAIRGSIGLHDAVRETQARQIVALVHAKQQSPAAERELLDIVARFKKAKSRFYQTTYVAMSEYCFLIGDQSRAMYYSIEAVKTMKATKDSSMAGDIYTNHAMMWTDNDEYRKGVAYIDLAIAHYTQRAGRYNLSHPLFLFDTEYIYGKTGNYEDDLRRMKVLLANAPPQTTQDRIYQTVIMARIYRRMKRYDQSEQLYKRAYAISKKSGVNVFRTTAGLAQVFVDSKQYAKARPLLYEELAFPKTFFNNGSLRHLHYMAYLNDSATGNYFDAIKHLSVYSDISHHDLTQSREREVQRLRIAFEAQQKEDEIKIKNQNIRLLSQNAKIQEERLRNANLTMVMSFFLATFLVVVSVLIFSKYRQKARNSHEIEHKNTIITEKNMILEHLLHEKEWLLKEVHHRVKNNLHTIICLLESQASYLGNEALKALETSQNRIYAMSLIHQKLYQSDDIRSVDMKGYFTEFLLFLSETFDASNRVRIIQDIAPVKLPATQAIPIALIVNESVTNAFKHAFPGKLEGIVRISLLQQDGEISLTIEDNGIGWDESDYNPQNSLGIQLMRGLSEDMGAGICFENQSGTRISLTLRTDLSEEQETRSSLFA